MVRESEIREGEQAVEMPKANDAGLVFIGRLRTHWTSRRDVVLQSPKNNKSTRGTFSLRSPVRPNPLGTSIVKLVRIEGSTVLVRGLDCLDETPLVDLKPDRCEFTPLAPPQAGDLQTE